MIKMTILRYVYAGNRLRALPNRESASLTLIQGRNWCIEAKIRKCLSFASIHPFPESGSGKHFHASGMRGIDFPYKITPRGSFFRKKILSLRTTLVAPQSGIVPKILNVDFR